MNNNGVIYVLTNRSFPDYVKIGYADDVQRRLVELNRSECMPFAFRVYATYEVSNRLTDLSLHRLIDKLNPTLRAIDTFNGKPRKKEFYAMSAEDAYSLLEAIAEIHGQTDKLKLYPVSEEEKAAEEIAEIVEQEAKARKKSQPISLDEYLDGKNSEFVALYQRLQADVFDCLDDAEMYVLPQYIGWRVNGKLFGELHIQRNKLKIMTLEPLGNFALGERVPDNYLWSLNYRSFVESSDDLKDAKGILMDSYRQRAGICDSLSNESNIPVRRSAFAFSKCGIGVGEEVVLIGRSEVKCVVVDDNHVEFNGKKYALSYLAKEILGHKHLPQGPAYFSYKGERLDDLRRRIEG